MEEGLFSKYKKQIQKQIDERDNIIMYIKNKTGIEIQKDLVLINKKQITLHTSSVIKQKLFQKGIKEDLLQRGYILR